MVQRPGPGTLRQRPARVPVLAAISSAGEVDAPCARTRARSAQSSQGCALLFVRAAISAGTDGPRQGMFHKSRENDSLVLRTQDVVLLPARCNVTPPTLPRHCGHRRRTAASRWSSRSRGRAAADARVRRAAGACIASQRWRSWSSCVCTRAPAMCAFAEDPVWLRISSAVVDHGVGQRQVGGVSRKRGIPSAMLCSEDRLSNRAHQGHAPDDEAVASAVGERHDDAFRPRCPCSSTSDGLESA